MLPASPKFLEENKPTVLTLNEYSDKLQEIVGFLKEELASHAESSHAKVLYKSTLSEDGLFVERTNINIMIPQLYTSLRMVEIIRKDQGYVYTVSNINKYADYDYQWALKKCDRASCASIVNHFNEFISRNKIDANSTFLVEKDSNASTADGVYQSHPLIFSPTKPLLTYKQLGASKIDLNLTPSLVWQLKCQGYMENVTNQTAIDAIRILTGSGSNRGIITMSGSALKYYDQDLFKIYPVTTGKTEEAIKVINQAPILFNRQGSETNIIVYTAIANERFKKRFPIEYKSFLVGYANPVQAIERYRDHLIWQGGDELSDFSLLKIIITTPTPALQVPYDGEVLFSTDHILKYKSQYVWRYYDDDDTLTNLNIYEVEMVAQKESEIVQYEINTAKAPNKLYQSA